MFKIIIVALLLSANIAVANTITTCRPDGNGGFICTERPKCMPGTVCS